MSLLQDGQRCEPFWLAWKMWVCVMISFSSEKFNVAIFSDIINIINVKLCMMVVIELYLFIPLLVTSLYIKVTAVSNSCNWKFLCVYLNKLLNFVRLLITSSRSWVYHYFWFLHVFRGHIWHISSFGKKKKKKRNLAFFSDTIKARPLKLCMVITSLWSILSF